MLITHRGTCRTFRSASTLDLHTLQCMPNLAHHLHVAFCPHL